MNILLTNDDGFHAEGINFLEEYFKKTSHKIFVIAPDREKSGASNSMTFKDTIRLVKHTGNKWIVKGTPADCTHLGLLGLLPEKPDIVISGINHGYNIGVDILYSGTVGAARQASIHKVPAIALSSNYINGKMNFDLIKAFLDRNIEILMKNASCRFITNINFPDCELPLCNGIKITTLSKKHGYFDKLITFDSPQQGRYYWIEGDIPDFDADLDTDSGAVSNNNISVSFINVLPETVDTDIKFTL